VPHRPAKVKREEAAGKGSSLLQSPRLCEQMGCMRDDFHARLAPQLRQCHAVELEHFRVISTDDEQGWRVYLGERGASQIRAAAA
jgi:hypothetical protein